MKKPVMEWVKATKSATTELNNAMKTEITRQGKGKIKGKGDGKGKAGTSGSTTLRPSAIIGADLFATVPDKHGREMASCCLDSGSTSADLKSLEEPAIIRCASLKDKLIDVGGIVKVLNDFVLEFDKTDLRQQKGARIIAARIK